MSLPSLLCGTRAVSAIGKAWSGFGFQKLVLTIKCALETLLARATKSAQLSRQILALARNFIQRWSPLAALNCIKSALILRVVVTTFAEFAITRSVFIFVECYPYVKPAKVSQ